MKRADQIAHAQSVTTGLIFSFAAGLQHDNVWVLCACGAGAAVLLVSSIFHVGALHDELEAQDTHANALQLILEATQEGEQRTANRLRSIQEDLVFVGRDLREIKTEQVEQRPTVIRRLPVEITNTVAPKKRTAK